MPEATGISLALLRAFCHQLSYGLSAFFYIWRIISRFLNCHLTLKMQQGSPMTVDGAGIFYLVHAHLCSRFMVFPPVRFQSAAKHPLPGHGTYFKASCRLYE